MMYWNTYVNFEIHFRWELDCSLIIFLCIILSSICKFKYNRKNVDLEKWRDKNLFLLGRNYINIFYAPNMETLLRHTGWFRMMGPKRNLITRQFSTYWKKTKGQDNLEILGIFNKISFENRFFQEHKYRIRMLLMSEWKYDFFNFAPYFCLKFLHILT